MENIIMFSLASFVFISLYNMMNITELFHTNNSVTILENRVLKNNMNKYLNSIHMSDYWKRGYLKKPGYINYIAPRKVGGSAVPGAPCNYPFKDVKDIINPFNF
jgi:hypothetical protein